MQLNVASTLCPLAPLASQYIHHHELAKWQRKAHNMCLGTFRKGELVIETDFIEKYRHEARSVMTCATAPTTTMMVALVHHSPDGGQHTTDAWVFVSSDPNHDFDFHIYALDIILQHYITGEGRAATAGTRVPTVHMFTDGCAKQYKGKRNFMAVAQSLRRLGVILIHNFAVTSHFKGAHDGVGGLLKTLMREAEKRGQRIHDTTAVYKFLSSYAKQKEGGMGGHFATWSPYRIAGLHIRQLGFKEIPRPPVVLTGVSGSSDLYQFMGMKDQQDETTGVSVGVQAVCSKVLADGKLVSVDNSLPVGDDRELVAFAGNWVVDRCFPRILKISRKYKLRVRQTSCYCSECRVGAYERCIPAKKYLAVVGMVKIVSGKENPTLVSHSEEESFHGSIQGPREIYARPYQASQLRSSSS